MENSPFLYLTYNVALLLALAVLFDTAGYRQRVTLTYWRQVIVGLFIGGIGIAIMLTPWTYSAGIVFDTRSVLLGISGLFFGLIPTLIAMVMTAALRISMGGAATLTGVSVIIATSMLGIAWRYLRRRSLSDLKWYELYLFGIILHLVMLSLMFLLPFETALQVLRAILLPVLLLYPLGTTLLGMLMVNRLRREMMHEELRISEERLRLVGKAANIGYFIRDLITNQEQYSLEWKQQLGYEDEEIKNDVNEWLSRVHPDDLPQVKTRIESCIHNHQPYYEAEYRLRHKDGSFRWILARGYLHYNDAGKATHLLGCHIDLTQQKQIEEQIRKLNTELDQRVHDRTAQLEAANQELEAFAYSVSHDLRAPLRAMDGFSAALLEGYSDSLDEQGKLFLKRIQEASRRMAQLINDLLNLSRVTRLDFKRQQVNLSQLAHEIAESLCAQNPDRNLQFQIDKEMIVEGDAQLLRIVLDNLLGNAVKFTSIRSDAVISFGYIDNQPNGRVYFVRDNGVGFNMEYANKLFAPFQRLHNNNDFPGTGIGLATVKRIITRHGGKIWTDAQEGEGAAFYFTLGEI